MASRVQSRSRSRSALRQASRERPARLVKSSQSSRSCSPAVHNRRIAKLDQYMAKSLKRNSVTTLNQSSEHNPHALSSHSIKEVKWWDGNQRMTVKWDSIRRVSSALCFVANVPNFFRRILSCGILTGTASFTFMSVGLQREVHLYVSRLQTLKQAIAPPSSNKSTPFDPMRSKEVGRMLIPTQWSLKFRMIL